MTISPAALPAGFCALALAALAGPVGAGAQPVSAPTGPDTYLELHLGALAPQHDDLDPFDTGFDLGGTFGARLGEHLGVEAELAWTRATGQVGETDVALQTIPFSASVRGTLPFAKAELHALAGVGLHLAELSADLAPGGADLPRSEWKTGFGWHVGAGVGFSLWPTTRVGLEVRRTFAEAPFDGGDLRLDALRVAVTLAYEL